MGFVRAVADSTDSAKVKSAFNGEVALGLVRRLYGGLGALLEASYSVTLDTPRVLRSQPLGGLAVHAGLGYGF
jgi:hypothetical protein